MVRRGCPGHDLRLRAHLGHPINPAVSIALWATGRFPARDMLVYVIMQLIGGFLASTTIYALWGARAVDAGLGITLPGVSELHPGDLRGDRPDVFPGLAIWGSAVDTRAPGGFAGLAIGLVVAADIWVGGPLTGASMNPARSFGLFLARAPTEVRPPTGESSRSTSSARSSAWPWRASCTTTSQN